MSFSKAKIKRFNDIPVVDSPSERKDHIKKFLKDIKDSCKDSNKESKEKESKDKKILGPPSTPSDAESVKSSRSLRLFRTPSLPKRLRFRQNSDITPKKDLQRDLVKEKEALEAANVEIKNKTEVLQDYEGQIDELKVKIFQLKESEKKQNDKHIEELSKKDETIENFSKEIEDIKEANKKLKETEVELNAKVKKLEDEIQMLLKSHDSEIAFLINTNAEVEITRDKLMKENHALDEENKALKQELDNIAEETNVLKIAVQSGEEQTAAKGLEIEKLVTENLNLLAEIQTLKRQIEDDILSYAEETQNMVIQLDDLKREKARIREEIQEKCALIKALEDELSDKDVEMDVQRDSIREGYQEEMKQLTRKYEQQIATIKEMNDMKIKEIESVHILEVSKLARDHQNQMKESERLKQEQLERLNEVTEEKIRISEIQSEQRIRALEMQVEQSIQRETQLWKSEIDKCQKIAESEIIQSELEKQDLKTLLQSANEMLRERDDKIRNLEIKLNNGIDYYVSMSEKLETEVNDVKQECARIMTEKYNYQLTLNNTRSTVNILMERLKKSDTDVETLKAELDVVTRTKGYLEIQKVQLEQDLNTLRNDMENYKSALTALHSSSQALEKEMKEKETIFEKLMTSEEETLETVNKIGKLFNDRIEENIDKYFEMYMDLKRKYESRETYIKDMKSLLDEFGTGIELARIELDTKDKQIIELEEENKNIKLENMTLRFKMEQFESYVNSEMKTVIHPKLDEPERDLETNEDMINNRVIESVLSNLDADFVKDCDKFSDELRSYETRNFIMENFNLKEKLTEQIKRNDLLQEMIDLEGNNAVENVKLKEKVQETEKALKSAEKFSQELTEKYNELEKNVLKDLNEQNMDDLRETDVYLKNKILQLRVLNKEKDASIYNMQEQYICDTPRKNNGNVQKVVTPKTPRTPKCLLASFPAGKENRSPALDGIKASPKNVLKPRN